MTQPLTGQRSQREPISELYDRHAAELFVYCYDQLGDSGAAADVLITVLVGAPPTERSRASLYALARREIGRRDVRTPPPATDSATRPATSLIERVFREMRPHQREVLLLSAVCGLPTEELATILDVAVDTASDMIFSARNRFTGSLTAALTHARSTEYVSKRLAEVYGALEVAGLEDALSCLPWPRPPLELRERILSLAPALPHVPATGTTTVPGRLMWPTTPNWPVPLAEPDEITQSGVFTAKLPPLPRAAWAPPPADGPGDTPAGTPAPTNAPQRARHLKRPRHDETTTPIPRMGTGGKDFLAEALARSFRLRPPRARSHRLRPNPSPDGDPGGAADPSAPSPHSGPASRPGPPTGTGHGAPPDPPPPGPHLDPTSRPAPPADAQPSARPDLPAHRPQGDPATGSGRTPGGPDPFAPPALDIASFQAAARPALLALPPAQTAPGILADPGTASTPETSGRTTLDRAAPAHGAPDPETPGPSTAGPSTADPNTGDRETTDREATGATTTEHAPPGHRKPGRPAPGRKKPGRSTSRPKTTGRSTTGSETTGRATPGSRTTGATGPLPAVREAADDPPHRQESELAEFERTARDGATLDERPGIDRTRGDRHDRHDQADRSGPDRSAAPDLLDPSDRSAEGPADDDLIHASERDTADIPVIGPDFAVSAPGTHEPIGAQQTGIEAGGTAKPAADTATAPAAEPPETSSGDGRSAAPIRFRRSHKRPKPIKVGEHHFDWLWELVGLVVAIGIALIVFFTVPMIITP